MRRLLFFNLATDADDPALGFAVTWLAEFAKHVAAIDVITMRTGRFELPSHVRVYSVGKEKGYSEPWRVIEFYRILFRLLRHNHYDGCFAHMMPLFAMLAAPFLRLKHIPIVLWYTHKSVTLTLRMATWLVNRVVTASPESFRIRSSKVRVIGHGIDTDRFTPFSFKREVNYPFTILTIGRLSKSKRIDVLINAVTVFHKRYPEKPIRVNIVGTGMTERDQAYIEQLHQQVAQQGLSEIIDFVGSVQFEDIPIWHQQADCFVSISDTGSIDKVVLEAMSCGVPPLAPDTYAGIFGEAFAPLLVITPEPEVICEHLHAFATMSSDEKKRLGVTLREIVIRDHALATISERIFQEFRMEDRTTSVENQRS